MFLRLGRDIRKIITLSPKQNLVQFTLIFFFWQLLVNYDYNLIGSSPLENYN